MVTVTKTQQYVLYIFYTCCGSLEENPDRSILILNTTKSDMLLTDFPRLHKMQRILVAAFAWCLVQHDTQLGVKEHKETKHGTTKDFQKTLWLLAHIR